ncbi:MAG: Uma2 family endonuclease [Myxococcota bacterium]
MRTAPQELPPREDDGLVLVRGTWEVFRGLLDARGEAPRPRFAFDDGDIEIMSPGRAHEVTRSKFGTLLELYFLHARIRAYPWGSTRLSVPNNKKSLEPDEAYALSERDDRPDLAIEVVYTSGGLDKLKIYAALEVPEVWFWTAGEGLRVFVLRGDGYVPSASSPQLPKLDLSLLERHLGLNNDLFELQSSFLAALNA